MMSNILLCVNIDHIATLRQARGGVEPDPLAGASICEDSGADGITVHLREDRRHIQDRDVQALKKIVRGKYNLEMALSEEIVNLALDLVPDQVTLVPEKRQELTTEGGLDVRGQFQVIERVTGLFHKKNILVSLFIEPDEDMVKCSRDTGADFIELHTGAYCNAFQTDRRGDELERIYRAAEKALAIGIRINAGHGLNYDNTGLILKTPGLEELNIGHSIISRSVFTGLGQAVCQMKDIIKGA